MTVADEHIASIGDVDAVGKVGDVLAANATHELTVLVEHDHTVAFEVAHVVLGARDGDVRRLAHVLRAVEPFEQIAVLRDAKHGGGNAVHGHNLSVMSDSKTSNNINISNRDL